MSRGFVSLVGAGPGGADFLTLAAVKCLRRADLTLYDALVAPEVLRYAHRGRCFFVGKRAGRHAMSQEQIQRLMIRSARSGQRVVRLKGGDPFVFGRGGEEALALTQAGIGFEVVPGVSSAIAAPTLAGIPVTHRSVSSGFLVISGHDAATYEPMLRAVSPHAITIVVMMGVARRNAIGQYLRSCGWRADTPVALIQGAGTAAQSVSISTLDHIEQELAIDRHLPGTLVIGDVVAVRSALVHASPQPARLRTAARA